MDSASPFTRSHFIRVLLAGLWVALFAIFFTLRFDASERTYFQIDDQMVVWLVDDAVNNGNWQPDWYRAGENAKDNPDYAEAKAARDKNFPHEHHYNFSAHMLLSAAIIKPLRLLGITTPTIALLHHIALMWDTVSLLLLIAAARQLGGLQLALCSAIIYTVFPLAVQGSHYARPDAFLTAMSSAILLLALQKNSATQKGMTHWRWLLANGLILGLAVGGKASQLMLGIFPALASASVLFDRQEWIDRQAWRIKTFSRIALDGITLLALIAAVLMLMFFIGTMTVKDFWLSIQIIQQYYQHPGPPDTLEHYSFGAQLLKILHYFYATLGWPLVIALFAGAISLTRKADKLPLLLLTAPLVFFILYFANLPAFFDRSFGALTAAIVLLAAIGINTIINSIRALPAKIFVTAIVTLLACWKPIAIQYHLQTQHLRSHYNDERLAFQKKLKEDWSLKNGKDYWIKNIDSQDLFSQTLPEKPPKNPRIYVAEDMNDWNSRAYLQKLRDNGFVEIAKFDGDFADMPTNSLITVHEAAHFVYFVRKDEMPTDTNQASSKSTLPD